MEEVFVFAILVLKKSFSNARTAFDLRQICSPWGNNQTTLTLFKSFGNTKIKQKSSQRTCTTTRLLIPTHTHTHLKITNDKFPFYLHFKDLVMSENELQPYASQCLPCIQLWENMPHTCFFLARESERESGKAGLWHLLVCSKLSTNHVSFGKMSWRFFCLRLVFFSTSSKNVWLCFATGNKQ